MEDKMDDVEATMEIMKIESESRIIFLSAYISVQEEAIKSGVMTFLKKPVSINIVSQTVFNTLN